MGDLDGTNGRTKGVGLVEPRVPGFEGTEVWSPTERYLTTRVTEKLETVWVVQDSKDSLTSVGGGVRSRDLKHTGPSSTVRSTNGTLGPEKRPSQTVGVSLPSKYLTQCVFNKFRDQAVVITFLYVTDKLFSNGCETRLNVTSDS